jgi:alpha-tubulin suppressor-like RCC1 family protein
MSKPTKVEAFSAYTILSISAGSNHSLAAVSIGGRPLLISWGCQKQGQLGLPQTKAVSSMPGVVSRFSDLTLKHTSAGAYHSALIISEEDTTHPKLSHKDQGFARVLRVWNELSQK